MIIRLENQNNYIIYPAISFVVYFPFGRIKMFVPCMIFFLIFGFYQYEILASIWYL